MQRSPKDMKLMKTGLFIHVLCLTILRNVSMKNSRLLMYTVVLTWSIPFNFPSRISADVTFPFSNVTVFNIALVSAWVIFANNDHQMASVKRP